MLKFWKDLVTNNTGVSSKTFTLVMSVMLVFFIIINFLALLWVDLLIPEYKIETDLIGLAGMITPLGALLGWMYREKRKSD